jgi:putative FmdB family regulatory protein
MRKVMPLYEYQCQVCEHKITVLQKMGECAIKECESCQELAMKKLISMPNFQLKGGGWFKDGYSSKSSQTKSPEKPKKNAETKV